MKKYTSIISLFVVILAACWGFYDLKPISVDTAKQDTDFSVEKALFHLKNIAEEIHLCWNSWS